MHIKKGWMSFFVDLQAGWYKDWNEIDLMCDKL